MKRILRFQFILFLLSIVSCSGTQKKIEAVGDVFGEKKEGNPLEITSAAKWFDIDEKYQLVQTPGDVTKHAYYDATPDLDVDTSTVNFIAIAPEGSQFAYNVDQVSGQMFFEKAYCEHKDRWGNYTGKIKRPPFTLGIIPKYYDQVGDKQKIIVFGDKDHYQKNFMNSTFEARIVGAFIEYKCPKRKCKVGKDWLSRLVLVGVQNNNSSYEKVQDMKQLAKEVDWDYVKAFMQNGQGVNYVAGEAYPAYKMGIFVPKEKALKYIERKSMILRDKQLNAMKKSCHKLYDKIWNSVGKDSKYEMTLKKLKTANERKAFLDKNKVKRRDLFHYRFIQGFKRYQKEYKTCAKFIYPTNLNHDSERHWFFAYYSAVHFAHDLGYRFNCVSSRWQKALGKSDLDSEFKRCNAKKIDKAFETSVMLLSDLRKGNKNSYRYIDYDRRSYGTHKKIYSWVSSPGTRLSCANEYDSLAKKLETFPGDVSWKRRRLGINKKGQKVK